MPGRAFAKSGSDSTRKNSLNDIRNYTYIVEPHPKIETRVIDDPGNGKFYVILKVERKVVDLLSAVKGQFFVRVGASNSPASPRTVLNLFSEIKQKIRDVDWLSTVPQLH